MLRNNSSRPLNPTVSTQTVSVVLVAVAVVASVVLFESDSPSALSAGGPLSNPADATALVSLPDSGYLAPGTPVPPVGPDVEFAASDQSFDGYSGRLTVLDLWDEWCPFARELSPGQVVLRDEYPAELVQFVSLTVRDTPPPNSPRRGWLAGYQAIETLKAFRCLFHDVTYGLSVHPTIYLIGSDGRVVWCDDGMRERHADPEEVERILRAAIDDALRQSGTRGLL